VDTGSKNRSFVEYMSGEVQYIFNRRLKFSVRAMTVAAFKIGIAVINSGEIGKFT